MVLHVPPPVQPKPALVHDGRQMPVLLELPKAAHTYPGRQVDWPFCGPGQVAAQNGSSVAPEPTHAAPLGQRPAHCWNTWHEPVMPVQADEQYPPPGQGKHRPLPFGSQVLPFVQAAPVGLSASVQLPFVQTVLGGQLKHWLPKFPHAAADVPD